MKNQITAYATRTRILVLCTSFLFVACISIVASARAELISSASQQTVPAEKTVEQVQKNIQALKGLPQSQLIPVMNFMGTSLGVKCTFCHVNKDGKWDFASDEKPEKATAREMIKMVIGINKADFKGVTEVSCYTCHRGQTHPASVPPLSMSEGPRPGAVPPDPAASPVASPGTSQSASPKEALPTAEQILAKYQEALGGSAAIDKLKTRTMKGTWLTSNGMSLAYEVYQSGPDKLYSVLITPKQGTFERGVDGSAGWEKSAGGLRSIESTELYYLRRYPDLFKDIKLKEQFTRLGGVRKDKLGDREVYVLRGATTDNRNERLYFDAQTGLLLRRASSYTTPIGVIPEQVDFEDYREVDGMKLPFTIRITSLDDHYTSTRKFTEIKLNVPVDETKFKKPAASLSPSP
ncbi:MAG: c-type cytochrome [Acidobacteriota bacterium]|nr:c-type cytochrome [Acidobacteriota bacterium]